MLFIKSQKSKYILTIKNLSNRLEVDFAFETKNFPIVIEVKSTNSKSKSLSTLVFNPMAYGTSNLKCLKLYEKNISYNKEKKILNLPYYAIDFIGLNALFDE